MNDVVALKGIRTFENTIMPINNLEYDYEFLAVPISFYSSVAVSKEMREASKTFDKNINDFNLDLWMRDDVYNCFIEYKKNADKDGSFIKLDKES